MAVRRRKAERAEVTVGNVAQAVNPVGILRLLDERDVAQLTRQQMHPKDAFGVMVAPGMPPSPEDQRGLQDVARIIGLAVIGIRLSVRLGRPPDFVAQLPEAVVVERSYAIHQRCIAHEVGQLCQRGHDAGDGVCVRAEGVAVVASFVGEVVSEGFIGEDDGEVEGRCEAGCPVQFHQRPDGSGETGDEGGGVEGQTEFTLYAVGVPVRKGIPAQYPHKSACSRRAVDESARRRPW